MKTKPKRKKKPVPTLQQQLKLLMSRGSSIKRDVFELSETVEEIRSSLTFLTEIRAEVKATRETNAGKLATLRIVEVVAEDGKDRLQIYWTPFGLVVHEDGVRLASVGDSMMLVRKCLPAGPLR
jgi:hypothetical protein